MLGRRGTYGPAVLVLATRTPACCLVPARLACLGLVLFCCCGSPVSDCIKGTVFTCLVFGFSSIPGCVPDLPGGVCLLRRGCWRMDLPVAGRLCQQRALLLQSRVLPLARRY